MSKILGRGQLASEETLNGATALERIRDRLIGLPAGVKRVQVTAHEAAVITFSGKDDERMADLLRWANRTAPRPELTNGSIWARNDPDASDHDGEGVDLAMVLLAYHALDCSMHNRSGSSRVYLPRDLATLLLRCVDWMYAVAADEEHAP